MLSETSQLWRFLSEGQRSLIRQGSYLVEDSKSHTPLHQVSDYSYLVFPFAKAYEGFLKQLFLELGLIKKWQYESDHFRIGKVLSPGLVKLLRDRSVYQRLTKLTGTTELPDLLWRVWKRGRNRIFHYFPHNISAVSQTEAEEIIAEIISAMEQAVAVQKPPTKVPRMIE